MDLATGLATSPSATEIIRRYVRPGDWLVVALIVAALVWLCASLWTQAAGDVIIVRSKGSVVAELSLQRNRSLSVSGPLGDTIVEVKNQQVRIARDPSPRQICVRHGWLSKIGDMALCLPNQVSVEIGNARGHVDSLNY